jgi:hypothetical protein
MHVRFKTNSENWSKQTAPKWHSIRMTFSHNTVPAFRNYIQAEVSLSRFKPGVLGVDTTTSFRTKKNTPYVHLYE